MNMSSSMEGYALHNEEATEFSCFEGTKNKKSDSRSRIDLIGRTTEIATGCLSGIPLPCR